MPESKEELLEYIESKQHLRSHLKVETSDTQVYRDQFCDGPYEFSDAEFF